MTAVEDSILASFEAWLNPVVISDDTTYVLGVQDNRDGTATIVLHIQKMGDIVDYIRALRFNNFKTLTIDDSPEVNMNEVITITIPYTYQTALLPLTHP